MVDLCHSMHHNTSVGTNLNCELCIASLLHPLIAENFHRVESPGYEANTAFTLASEWIWTLIGFKAGYVCMLSCLSDLPFFFLMSVVVDIKEAISRLITEM